MPRIAKKVKAKATEESPVAVAVAAAPVAAESPVKPAPVKAPPEKRAPKAEPVRPALPKPEAPKAEQSKPDVIKPIVIKPPVVKPEPVQPDYLPSERTLDNVKAAAQADAQRDAANYSKANAAKELVPPAAPVEASDDDGRGGDRRGYQRDKIAASLNIAK